MKRTELKRKTPLKNKTALKAVSSKPKPKPKPTAKAKASKNSKIRKSANGQGCLVRLPGVCNHNNETTVAAHIRAPGVAGMGQKPSDILTVRACSSCHDEIDRRTRFLEADFVKIATHEAHCRTLIEYINEGLIKIEGA